MRRAHLLLIATAALTICGASSADTTLLVDFGPFKSGEKKVGKAEKPASTAEDFAIADPQIDPSAPIANLAINMQPKGAGNTHSGLQGLGLTADIAFNKKMVGYGAFNGAYAKEPIVSSYLYVNKNDASVTVSSLEEIAPAATVTVAAWGGGDKPGQDTTFSIAYDGNRSESQQVLHGAPLAEAAAVFTFTKVDGVDEVTIHYGNPDNYAGFGGFSISSQNAPAEAAEPE